jgi:outer membrane protein assembly factor BamD
MAVAFRRRSLAAAALAVALLAAGGCSSLKFWDKDQGDKVIQGSPEQLYSEAIDDVRSNDWAGAIQRYEMLEARYPFSEQAKQGQLDLLYAYYKGRAAESAIDQADQFIRENPTHPRVDYAYYIRGLVYFDSGANWLERKFKADIAKRPPTEAMKSFQAFQTLLQRYPKSPYAADARQRMVYLRNRLADYEVEVARFYMKRGAYVGAANRAKGVVVEYDGAPAVDDALRIMAAAYRRLEIEDLAQVVDKVRSGNLNPDALATTPGAGLAIGGTAGVAGAAATGESSGSRWSTAAPAQAGRWEASIGTTAAMASDVDFEGGTTAEIDSGFGLVLGAGYNLTDRLRLGSTFTYDQKDYEAVVAGDEANESFPIEGSLDTMALMLDVAYTFMTGPVSPYMVGGVGWSWVDTNIASEPPQVGCWWHPWWGYVCTSWQDTRTVDGLAYEVGLGMRYDFSDSLAADAAYRMRWVDFENATGTPSFDTMQLNLVWKF